MRKTLLIFLLLSIGLVFISCSFMSRVLKQTETEAIVEGAGYSKAEARINAEKAASNIFQKYEEYKEAEYNEQIGGSGASIRSGFICTMYIRKI